MSIERAAIEANLRSIHERIAEAALRSGRPPEAVRLVAITKSHPEQAVRAAFECGQRDFGENRVEEAQPKQAALDDLSGIRWHMVGKIQSRKARDVAGHFAYVHSVDRMKIARRLNQYQAGVGESLHVLLEINASGEDTKAGWYLPEGLDWAEFMADFQQILSLPHLHVGGLMTMAALGASDQAVRGMFARLREIRDQLELQLNCELPELSMGMSDDFEIAVEQGATMVRVGRAIFTPK
jgi:pyridoxal phosphate enzyme (YggS family)